MIINESAENYLETILVLSGQLPVVRSVDIAAELDFKKPSVSVAMKKLRESGHITVSPEGYITLTPSTCSAPPLPTIVGMLKHSPSNPYFPSSDTEIGATV